MNSGETTHQDRMSEQCLEALQRCAQAIGKPPETVTRDEYDAWHRRAAESTTDYIPSSSMLSKYMNVWPPAFARALYEGLALDALQRCARDIRKSEGDAPTYHDYETWHAESASTSRPMPAAVRKVFGSWAKAARRAGFKRLCGVDLTQRGDASRSSQGGQDARSDGSGDGTAVG